MVKKPEIQYIDKFYVYGSEAKVLELKPKRRIKTVLPLFAPDNTIKIAVDPVAIGGILVALALLVALVVGSVQYVQAYRQYRAMVDYVVTGASSRGIIPRAKARSRISTRSIWLL